mmetsp:Transcript_10117/g.12276  ORF Transcript_10117/g.12276 Transcript_10117/m.12276 type:complete len:153 (+) Transcript_10117:59-517(+)
MSLNKQDQLRFYAPVIKATTAYVGLYFSFMSFQSFSKFYLLDQSQKKGENKKLSEIKYGSKEGLGLVSDRTFLNMLEQAPLFLTSLWLHASFVCPQSAANQAWLYITFRAIYPIVFQMGIPWLFLSTGPNYLSILYMIGTTTMEACKAAKRN